MNAKILQGPWQAKPPPPKIRRSDPRMTEEHCACGICKDTQFIIMKDGAITCASCFTPVSNRRAKGDAA